MEISKQESFRGRFHGFTVSERNPGAFSPKRININRKTDYNMVNNTPISLFIPFSDHCDFAVAHQ